MSSSYRSNRFGLSHWDPYTVRGGGCLELYYCNMVVGGVVLVGFKPDLDDQLVSFSALTLSFGHLVCKNCLQMTYNVLSGTLSHYTTICDVSYLVL